MYGVVEIYGHDTEITWFDTLQQAFANASHGDMVIEKIEEIK